MDKDDKDYEHEIEVTEEEYYKMMDDIAKFEENFFKKLANSETYEIIPTVDSRNRAFSKDQFNNIRIECKRLGISHLYKIDHAPDKYILVNPTTLKIAYITDGIH